MNQGVTELDRVTVVMPRVIQNPEGSVCVDYVESMALATDGEQQIRHGQQEIILCATTPL